MTNMTTQVRRNVDGIWLRVDTESPFQCCLFRLLIHVTPCFFFGGWWVGSPWRSIFHRGGSSTRIILGRIGWLESCGCSTGKLVRHWSASPHRIIACWQCSPCYTRGCCKTKACSGKLGSVVLAIAFLIEQDEFTSSSGFSRGLDAIHCCGRSTWRYRTASHCTTCHVFVLFFAPVGTNLGKSSAVEHLAHGTGVATLVGRGCHRKGIRKSLFCRFETCNRGEFLRPSHRWWGYILPLPRDAFSSWKGSWTSQTGNSNRCQECSGQFLDTGRWGWTCGQAQISESLGRAYAPATWWCYRSRWSRARILNEIYAIISMYLQYTCIYLIMNVFIYLIIMHLFMYFCIYVFNFVVIQSFAFLLTKVPQFCIPNDPPTIHLPSHPNLGRWFISSSVENPLMPRKPWHFAVPWAQWLVCCWLQQIVEFQDGPGRQFKRLHPMGRREAGPRNRWVGLTIKNPQKQL